MAFGKEGNPAVMAGSLSFFNPVKLKRKTPYRKLTYGVPENAREYKSI
jgi:hypothetical protein